MVERELRFRPEERDRGDETGDEVTGRGGEGGIGAALRTGKKRPALRLPPRWSSGSAQDRSEEMGVRRPGQSKDFNPLSIILQGRPTLFAP